VLYKALGQHGLHFCLASSHQFWLYQALRPKFWLHLASIPTFLPRPVGQNFGLGLESILINVITNCTIGLDLDAKIAVLCGLDILDSVSRLKLWPRLGLEIKRLASTLASGLKVEAVATTSRSRTMLRGQSQRGILASISASGSRPIFRLRPEC